MVTPFTIPLWRPDRLHCGIVIHHHGVTLVQPLQGSVALVEAPGASGVPVGGWPGVKTDFRGDTTVGNLNVYQENTVSLDPSRLTGCRFFRCCRSLICMRISFL
ncbi:fimbria/pilus outer membrane usher protein [Salmonella enterica subsp. enterica]|nr:fimbria/pilus outer membrane usher protein [Salmonella enterica subsp. enterica]